MASTCACWQLMALHKIGVVAGRMRPEPGTIEAFVSVAATVLTSVKSSMSAPRELCASVDEHAMLGGGPAGSDMPLASGGRRVRQVGEPGMVRQKHGQSTCAGPDRLVPTGGHHQSTRCRLRKSM